MESVATEFHENKMLFLCVREYVYLNINTRIQDNNVYVKFITQIAFKTHLNLVKDNTMNILHSILYPSYNVKSTFEVLRK